MKSEVAQQRARLVRREARDDATFPMNAQPAGQFDAHFIRFRVNG
jgi:hypothetical protein